MHVPGIDFYRNAILNSSTWGYTTINGSTIELADSINPVDLPLSQEQFVLLNLNSGRSQCLRPRPKRSFQAKDGKVIEYHGFQDPVIPSLASGTWYDAVLSFYQDLDRVAEVEDFYRLFMVPGMTHCSGGDGGNCFSQLFTSILLQTDMT